MQANDPQETGKEAPSKGFLSSFKKGVRRLIASVLHWAPLWAPLVLLLQITFLGLRPALRELSLLEAHRIQVEDRWHKSKKAYQKAKKLNEAWQDPTFSERKERQWYWEAKNRKDKLTPQLPQEARKGFDAPPSTDPR